MSKIVMIEMEIPNYLNIEDLKDIFNHLASKRYGEYNDSEMEDCKIIDIKEKLITNIK